jgi:hypothetical protein
MIAFGLVPSSRLGCSLSINSILPKTGTYSGLAVAGEG